MDEGLKAKRTELRKFAKKHGLREDWHEPDEQEVSARVVGARLDNACCESISSRAILENFQEFVVIVEREEGVKGQRILINLASLLALACASG